MPEEMTETREMQIRKMEFYIPKWVEMLPEDHEIKKSLVELIREKLTNGDLTEKGIEDLTGRLRSLPFIQSVLTENAAAQQDSVLKIQLNLQEAWYYDMLSKLAGIEITGEYQLIGLIRELAGKKAEYEEIHQAMESVRSTGYGVILPGKEEISWEEPALIHNNNRYGVKMRAVSPSIHLIRAEIESEISPIIGSEQQAKDLIEYIREGSREGEGIWEINIFGKSVEQLMEEEISAKVSQIDEKNQQKLQKIITRIIDESSHGLICLII